MKKGTGKQTRFWAGVLSLAMALSFALSGVVLASEVAAPARRGEPGSAVTGGGGTPPGGSALPAGPEGTASPAPESEASSSPVDSEQAEGGSALPGTGAEEDAAEAIDEYAPEGAPALTAQGLAGISLAQQAEAALAAAPAADGRARMANPAVFGQSPAQPFLLTGKEHLAELAALVNSGQSYGNGRYPYAAAYYSLEVDLDMTGELCTPIGTAGAPFTGFVLGQNHSITGLALAAPQPNDAYQGLFFAGYTAANIQNLTVSPQFAGGGSAQSPYQIGTAAQLAALAGLVNNKATNAIYGGAGVHYVLTADLDLAPYATANGGTGWAPIGVGIFGPSRGELFFGGRFDGQNHQITGLTIHNPTADYQGLFGLVEGAGALVQNLHLVNASVLGQNVVGTVVAGNTGGTVQGCTAGGSVSGSAVVGGVAGGNGLGGRVQNCGSTADVRNVDAGGMQVGGVVGVNDTGALVQSCYAAGNVSGEQIVGGVVGYNNTGGVVQNCTASGSVAGTSSIGGLVGINSTGATVQNSYASGNVSGDNAIGGMVGANDGSLQNTAALGQSVAATGGNFGRVAGSSQTGATLAGNHAFSGMVDANGSATNWANIGEDKTDGDDLTYTGGAFSPKTLREILGGDETIWDFSTPLPTLKNLPGSQTGALPTHLGGSPFGGGDGSTEATAYEISTPAQLAKLAELVNTGTAPYADEGKYYKLTADIDLAGYASGQGWTPIGLYVDGTPANDLPFRGIFSGNGFAVYNLSIQNPAQDAVGLFGYIQQPTAGSVSLTNLGLVNCNIQGGNAVGGLVGFATMEKTSAIKNCYVSGSVVGKEVVGGLAGSLGGSLQSCYFTGSVGGEAWVGGLAGANAAPKISNCYAGAQVRGQTGVGGIFGGYPVGTPEMGTVENCFFTGSVTGSQSDVGGLAGSGSADTQPGLIKNCAVLAQSVSGGAMVGRVMGNQTDPSLPNPAYKTALQGNYAWGGLLDKNSSAAGWANKGEDKQDGADLGCNGTAFTPKTLQQIFDPAVAAGAWDFSTPLPTLRGVGGSQTGALPPYIWGGDGTKANPYLISTAAQLASLAELVNDPATNAKYGGPGVHYQMTNDIDLAPYAAANGGKGWTPIGTRHYPFGGVFDGGGYAVQNLSINRPTEHGQGLFGEIGGPGTPGALLQNLAVVNCDVTGKEEVGSLLGYSGPGATVQNCFATGRVKGYGAGGLVGFTADGTIQNCYASVQLTATGQNARHPIFGGLVGVNGRSLVQNCYATGAVVNPGPAGGVGPQSATGGLAGNNFNLSTSGASVLRGCLALGPSVSGSVYVGRVAGTNYGHDSGPPIMENNYAFTGMEITLDGSPKTPLENTKTGLDGQDKTLAELRNWQDEAWDGLRQSGAWLAPKYGYLPILAGFHTPQPNRRIEDVTRGMLNVDILLDGAPFAGATLKRTDVPEGQSYTTGTQGSALVDAGTYTLLSGAVGIKTGISIAADTTFEVVSLHFDTQGGSAVETQLVYKGEAPSQPAAPSREGYTFAGWNQKPDGSGPAFDFAAPLNAKATAYAQWQAVHKQYPVLQHFGSFTGSGSRTATIDAPHSQFLSLSLNGTPLDKAHYSTQSGSTLITLNEAYLKTLPNGQYTLHAAFTDGSAELPLTVAVPASSTPPAQSTTPQSPQTGDTLALWPLLALAAVALLGGGAALLVKLRGKKHAGNKREK